MYINVVKTVVHQVKDALNTPDCEPAAGNNKIGYEVVSIPADGRCGWRALLASQDVDSFKRVPRTYTHTYTVYVYIYIYICARNSET